MSLLPIPTALLALLLTLPFALLSPISAAPNPFRNCLSTTDIVYELRNTPLSTLNPTLLQDPIYRSLRRRGCPDLRPASSICHDAPSVGSGLEQIAPDQFLAISDHGPTLPCRPSQPDAPQRNVSVFALPNFAPTLVHLTADASNRALLIRQAVPLRDSNARLISGIPNTRFDDTPFALSCVGDRLPFDPNGLDPEDLARITGTDFVAIADEYSPSVVIANYKTGVIIARHVPISIAPLLANATYPIVADLPNVFASRRVNRGFESIIVDRSAKYVIAILESPMLGDSPRDTQNNTIIRCAYFDIVSIKAGVPTLAYSKSFMIEASSPRAYFQPNEQEDIRYSSAQYVAENRFAALERANGQLKLFLIDFSNATILEQTVYGDNLNLEAETNAVSTAAQLGVNAAEKTLIWDSAPDVPGGSVAFTGTFNQQGFAIGSNDTTKLWIINDNDYGLNNNGNVELRKISLGRSVMGATVCATPAHPPSPRINLSKSRALTLTNPRTFRISSQPAAGAAENFDVDDISLRAYVANDLNGTLDMYNLSTSPATPIKSYSAGAQFKPTSASVCNSINVVAVALFNSQNERAPGVIDLLDQNLSFSRRIESSKCFLPDHLSFSDDCRFLVVACEGEGADIPGGILVADFGGPANSRFRGARFADFKSFDPIASVLTANGVRLVESNIPSLDLEPEYVTIIGRSAYVTIMEANAIAVVDLYEAKVTELKPIGFIDRRRRGFGLDASDKDGGINIRNYGFLFGMPQPDTISSYMAVDGKRYLIFANEGGAKDDVEEARGRDITNAKKLNRRAAPGLKQLVEDDALLGRLKFSTIMGFNNRTNTQENMFHFGSRSFSIMALDGRIVFDSGEWFARLQEKFFPKIFNANYLDTDDLDETQSEQFDKR